jgi:hypothetical protein
MNARILTKAQFEEWFPNLPPLPDAAAVMKAGDYEASGTS